SLWIQGYYQATVEMSTVQQGELRQYTFVATSGNLYTDLQLVFQETNQYPKEELEKSLRFLYRSRKELAVDCLHRFSEIKKKLLALYVERGFLETEIDSGPTDFANGVASKVIKIKEKSPSYVADIVMIGSPEAQLQQKLKLQKGSVFRPLLVSQD